MSPSTYTNHNRRAEPEEPVSKVDTQSYEAADLVCKALGEAWKIERRFGCNGLAYLVQDMTGLTLRWHAITDTYSGPAVRWGIGGAVWPEANTYGMDGGDITVTVAKTPEKIARDTRSRLLEIAQANHEKAKLSVIGYALKEHEDWRLAQRLAALSPKVEISRDRPKRSGGYGQPCGVAIENRHGHKAEIDVSFGSSDGIHRATLGKLTANQLAELVTLVTSWDA